MAHSSVHLLQLDSTGLPPSGFLTLPAPPYLLRVRTSLIGSLFIDLPPKGTAFKRGKFYEYAFYSTFATPSEVDLEVSISGPFTAYVEYEGEHGKETSRKWHFTVEPSLHVPINSLSIITVISKLMGKRPWDGKLQQIRDKGYNMIHFTPLQTRGDSNSPYSPAAHLEFDPELFSSEEDVAQMIKKMSDIGLLALTDVVWNHVAHSSIWLNDHPEVGYNPTTAPHLIPAFELDDALLQFGRNLKALGYPTLIETQAQLSKIMDGIKKHVIGTLRLWEFYATDRVAIVKQTKEYSGPKVSMPTLNGLYERAQWLRESIEDESLGKRFKKVPDIARCAAILSSMGEDALTGTIDELNLIYYKQYDEDVEEIMNQLQSRISYLRVDDHGPRLGEVDESRPLIETLFTRLKDGTPLANNGWIWNADPLVDFASSNSRAYLRREVIVWGDCVKLRYGSGPEDNPWLWDYMKKYTQLMAKLFAGIRIDNCHSTPLHVGRYLLDVAREVRPNLFVVAELFTGSEQTDILFVEELGISSLIREAMQAGSPAELSRLVHIHGGNPIASFDQTVFSDGGEVQLVQPSSVHALFMDCTHDNQTPTERRTTADTLPTAALVSMCNCATGSTVGFDELLPHHIDVVGERRKYVIGGGISEARAKLNAIHHEMGSVTANEMYVHHEGVWITVHRLKQGEGYGHLLLAKTAFGNDGLNLTPIMLRGSMAEVEGAWALEVTGKAKEDDEELQGIPSKLVKLDPPRITQGTDDQGLWTRIEVPDNYPSGSIALVKTRMPKLRHDLDTFLSSGGDEAFGSLSLEELNAVLYRCEPEERDVTGGKDGVYDIPGVGRLTYAGLQGWWSVFRHIVRENNLGHPACQHLREGTWALDYLVNRLQNAISKYPGLERPTKWLQERFDHIKEIPSFLVPRCFAMVLQTAYVACRIRANNLFSSNIRKGHEFFQSLAMVSIQMVADVPSASLLPTQSVPSMAAGLPHFAFDWARCWGRDIFISLRGLLISTGRHEDAKRHILAFASVLKHGMIPNLLDSGRRPRYNSRDSVWFFLQNIQDYVELVPDGKSILHEKVKRRFPLNDVFVEVDDERAFSYESSILEIIFEVLQRHARGIHFREHNAGPDLDMQMSSKGFDIDVDVDWRTGFVHGGNQFNCGTWMDKMGESTKAGSKGVPGTPRDGAAVEITGMLKSTLRWVNQLHREGIFQWDSVECGGKNAPQTISLKDWEQKVQNNFERCFYIPARAEDDKHYDVADKIINCRGIYKDLYKSGKEYEDYQLRPNQFIAMTVAPELFDDEHACLAIDHADKVLHGPVGMKTLDPHDGNYRPYYNNSEDSTDFATSKGRNYHQGPEWVWCTGYFLRAYLHFYTKRGDLKAVLAQINARMEGHREHIKSSPWAGLTELTNKDGAHCSDSSPTQAWSAATLIDVFEDAAGMTRRHAS